MTWAAESVSQNQKVGAGGTVVAFATGDPDSGNPIAPCSEGADALNSGVSGEGAQDITDHYPNPKGAKRWATKRTPAKRLAHFG
jgi:hypothetical protein